ncbi:MAG TPA: D-alanyl-D-alanine carboxypeptidase/D-alanyl-D-alanine-endopeptidase [Candidatus Angelobacter sp.]|jgi:D-alanyl-D-alanine carboxypeptidase/D-alanyl-D-alanine-endopeptidase (penicillin-binding protein 4)|nr:D-alanyl-D-alanine carboxypeptidase/D-alanyl-D-alanine-endopeptidase [Candidatus Angelobacter sp.]
MRPASAQTNRSAQTNGSTRVLCALVLVLALQLSAVAAKKPAPKKDVAKEISAILAQPPLDRAHWGIDAVDLDTGKALYSQNREQLFLPASNDKLFTTAAALSIAGPDYRFHTTVEAEGNIDDQGRLLGNLVIVGRGDPNISGRILPYALKTQRTPPHTQILEEMADQVAKSGLKIVDGDLIGDDTYYAFERYAEGWALDDLQWSDGAPVSALSFNDNVVFVNILPGPLPGDKALIAVEPETGYYELDNRIVTSAAGITRKIGIHRDPGSKKIVLWGSLPLGDAGTKESLSIEDPAEFVAQLFRTLLEQRGITIRGMARARHGEGAQFVVPLIPPPLGLTTPEGNPPVASLPSASAPMAAPDAATMPVQPGSANDNPPPSAPAQNASANKVLAEHISSPFLEDIRVTNKTSQNLHAELALRLVGKLRGYGGSFEGGAAAVKQFLLQAGLKDDEFTFLDGSGLSRRDLVTPAATIQLLIYASRQPWGAAFEESLPVSGVDGSLADRFMNTPAAGLVHAKTGSLSHVNALSGYGQTQSGKRFVFSIFCNNHNLPGGKVLAAIDSVVQLLVQDGEPKK